MKINVGISNRHVHITKESANILFGENYELTKMKDLSQPGMFACEETLTIEGPKGKIEKVRIVGPYRNYNQVEISKTDSFTLGVNPPVRNSGDLENSSPITIIGPNGKLELNSGCIIAARHIHVTYEDLDNLNLKNNDIVSIRINSEKPAILGNVYVKASNEAALELHLDTDDANANLLKPNDEVEIILNEK